MNDYEPVILSGLTWLFRCICLRDVSVPSLLSPPKFPDGIFCILSCSPSVLMLHWVQSMTPNSLWQELQLHLSRTGCNFSAGQLPIKVMTPITVQPYSHKEVLKMPATCFLYFPFSNTWKLLNRSFLVPCLLRDCKHFLSS